MQTNIIQMAPELAVSRWFNTAEPITLSSLLGRPVLLHSFQLLCPGCVSDSIPQIKKIERTFHQTDLVILGLHTVFEHHSAMSAVTLEAFIDEYRLKHPVGIDMAEEGLATPITMRRYGMRGTPSSVLIGRNGEVLHHAYGVEDDLTVGARLALAIGTPAGVSASSSASEDNGCADGKCDVG